MTIKVKSADLDSNQGPSDYDILLQSDAQPSELPADKNLL